MDKIEKQIRLYTQAAEINEEFAAELRRVEDKKASLSAKYDMLQDDIRRLNVDTFPWSGDMGRVCSKLEGMAFNFSEKAKVIRNKIKELKEKMAPRFEAYVEVEHRILLGLLKKSLGRFATREEAIQALVEFKKNEYLEGQFSSWKSVVQGEKGIGEVYDV
jgi:hypothetical protein